MSNQRLSNPPQNYFEEKHIVQFGMYNSAVELHGS